MAATREAADRWFQMKEPEEIRIQLCSGGKVNAYAAMQYEGIEIDGIQITEVAQGVRVLFPYDFPEGRIVGLVEAATPDIRKSFVSLITARYEEEKAALGNKKNMKSATFWSKIRRPLRILKETGCRRQLRCFGQRIFC